MKSSLNKNFIYNLIYEIVIVLAPLIMVPYVSRVLGAELIGVRSYTFTILSYFELFANLGIMIYGQREIAKVSSNKEERSKVFFSLQVLKSISFSTVLSIYCLTFFAFNASSNYKTVFAIWIIHLCESFANITWYFQGVEKFKYISIRGIIIRTIQIAMTIILVKSTEDFYIYLVLYSLFPLLQGFTLWPFLIKDLDFKQIKNISIRKHIKPLIIFFIPTIATTIYSSVDKVMLGSILNDKTYTGYYESAQHIVLLCTTIFLSVYTVMRSRISASLNDNEKINKLINYFIKICFILVFPVALGVLSVSNSFVIVFFGEEYNPVVNMLKAFVPVIIFMGISGFLSAVYIVPYDKQKYLIIYYIVATIINVVINFILIPKIDVFGAIIGSIVSEFIVLIGCLVLSRNFINIKQYVVLGWKYIASSLIMFAAIYGLNCFLDISWLTLIIDISVGIAIYIVVLLLLREQILLNLLNKIFKRKCENNEGNQ